MNSIKLALITVILISINQLNAQLSIEPFHSKIEYENRQRNCIQVNLDPEPDTLKEAWRDYLKDNYDFKLKGIGFLSNKDLLSAEDVTVEAISLDAMDFYTQIIEDENGSQMKVFARHGYDIYITKEKYPKEFSAIGEILEKFITYYLPMYYEDNISDTAERVKKLTDESEDLKKTIENNTEEIEKLRKNIKQKEDAATSNKEKLELAQRKLFKRKEKLKRIKIQIKKL